MTKYPSPTFFDSMCIKNKFEFHLILSSLIIKNGVGAHLANSYFPSCAFVLVVRGIKGVKRHRIRGIAYSLYQR